MFLESRIIRKIVELALEGKTDDEISQAIDPLVKAVQERVQERSARMEAARAVERNGLASGKTARDGAATMERP